MTPNSGETEAQNASRRHGEVLHVRLSSVELERLRAIPGGESVTVSEVVRRLVRTEAGFLPAATGELRPAIQSATDQLRRVGVNFNQAVRAMNEGRVPYDEDLERALIAVGELVRRFREELKAMIARPRRASARRFTRPAGQNPRRKRTQNWIKTGGKVRPAQATLGRAV